MCDNKQLIEQAIEARALAYAPYSNYQVGAALLAEDGTVYTGANVELVNGNSNCAERTALFKAVANGAHKFIKIAVATEDGSGVPCGFCRQAFVEFCNKDFEIMVTDIHGNYQTYTLNQLLPHAFTPEVRK